MTKLSKIIWSLAAGAVATVGVAWACALWPDVETDHTWYSADGPLPAGAPPVVPEWLVLKYPEDRISSSYQECRGFGLRFGCRHVAEGFTGMIHGWRSLHTLMEWRAGWPMKALSCGARFDDYPWQLTEVHGGFAPPLWMNPNFRNEFPDTIAYLPMVPLGLGFAGDSILYGAAVLAACEGLALARRSLRRRAGRCAACGYDLRGGRGDDSPCPECGAQPASK